MSRWIEADAIKIPSTSVDMFENCRNCNLLDEFQVREIIDSAPSIDIVRCKECKHWRAYETWSECELWTDDPYESAKTKADDYCSYGERKSDEY